MSQKIGFDPDGVVVGASNGAIAVLGNTPVAQKTVNTIVTAVDPTTSGSALVASVHSIAVYAASQVNKVIVALQSYGWIT